MGRSIIEYIPRAILLGYAAIALIGTLWFFGSFSTSRLIFGILLVFCATYVGLVRLERGNNTHVIISALGAISSVYFVYVYWIRVVAHDASIVRVVVMLMICSIFIYFAISRIKVRTVGRNP